MTRSLLCFLVVPMAFAACSSSKDEPRSTLTAKEVPPTVAAVPTTLELVGTSAPGDVWTFLPTGAPNEYKLGHDNGTPANGSDDWSVVGTLAGLGSVPGHAAEDADGLYIYRPQGFAADQGVRLVRLAGFGWVFYVPGGLAHAEPTTVVAVERANCTLPANGDYRTFEVAAPTRPDGFRAPSGAQFRNSDLSIVPYRTETAAFRWDLHGVACEAGALTPFHPQTMTTYWTTAPNPPFPYSTPVPAEVTGVFSPSGAFMLDYGKGFGGTLAVPSATALPANDADITALTPLYRSRAFSGIFTSTIVTQPAGADRQDPSVTRIAITRSYWASLGTTDGHLATMNLFDLTDGRPVAPGTTASFDLSTLGGESGGAVILVNERDQGLNDLTLTGPVLRPSADSRTISAVVSGYSGSTESNGFLTTIRAPVPAGQEIYSSLYVAYLTLVPPRNCDAATLARPADASPAYLIDGSALGAPVRVTPTPSSIGLTVANSQALPPSPAHPVNGVEIKRDAPFTIDDPAPGQVWRLFCGPDYLWAPGARQDAQTGHGYASSGSLQPGTYILEHGVETSAANTADSTAKHFIVHAL